MTSSKGLSLVEVIVALSIITLVLTPLLGLQSSLVRTVSTRSQGLVATYALKNIWYQAHQEKKYTQRDTWVVDHHGIQVEYRTEECNEELPDLCVCENLEIGNASDGQYQLFGVWYYPQSVPA